MKKTLFVLAAMFTVFVTVHSQIPTDGLVAYYPFNGNANDESGNGNDGTVTGATLTTDRFNEINSAYEFDPIGQHIDFFSSGTWASGSHTISFWFNPVISENDQFILTKRSSCMGFGEPSYFEVVIPDNSSALNIGWGGSGGSYFIDVSFIPNQWYNLVYVVNGSNAAIYLNSVLVNSQTYSSNTNDIMLRAGNHSCSVPNDDYDGKFDDLGLWNRALSDSEIKELFTDNGFATVTDVDGNTYNTVTIGDQTWMAENLKTTTYNDGTPIPNITDGTEWNNLTAGAYCWYNNDEATNKDTYGALYNWYTVETGNLCPAGWHVPTDAEWTTLTEYLGGISVAGTKLKQTGTTHWDSPNSATNESGFTALPSGVRDLFDGFKWIGTNSHWWSATEDNVNTAYSWYVSNNNSGAYRDGAYSSHGFSVRCLKDSEATPSLVLTVEDVTANQGQGLEVPVSVSKLVADDNIIAYQFDIDYDNTVLEYTGKDLTGTLAEGGTVEINTSVAGKLFILYMNSTAITGAGDILLLQFNTLKADTTEVLISNAYLNATSVTDLTAGTVIIKDVIPPTAAISIDDTDIRCWDYFNLTAVFNEPMLESNAVKISLSGAVNAPDRNMTRINDTVYTVEVNTYMESGQVTISLSNGTDLWGNEVISTPTSGETFSIIPIKYGDVDDDGKILAYDAALTLQHSVGLDPLPTIDPLPWEGWRDTTANVDGVSGITANDAGMILQHSAGIITSFDASAKKSVSQGFISIEVVNNEIILYSYGDLLGLNISAVNEDQILGTPIIMAENFMIAKNINGNTYKIGICTANSPDNGVEIMKIPFTKSGAVTLDMIINTEVDARTLNLSYFELTGIDELNAGNITIYPNPASDILNVEGLQKQTTGRIYNANGQMVFSSEIDAANAEVNVSGLPSGLYILKMNVGGDVMVRRFMKE